MPKFRTVPTEYQDCRGWYHKWDKTTLEKVGGEWIQGLRCSVCKTEKIVHYCTRTGLRIGGNHYHYPEDLFDDVPPYKMEKGTGGALTAEERGLVKLGEMEARYAAITDELAKRRKRKRA